ncbi:hypothetical protein FRC03_009628 [Tulasnella sp. 419]|nr:hypothetical protein FRC03_009628 [Tulasnella sp. 419]
MTSSVDDADILGIVVLARHGDRILSYQNPVNYESSYTSITPVGETQARLLGSLLRSRYIARSSSSAVQGLSDTAYVDGQAAIFADASGEENVTFDTALAVTQGLWPATNASNITLAEGSVVRSPLNGYQYVPIEMIRPDNAVFLDGWTDCLKFLEELDNFYDSSAFAIKARETAEFRQSLQRFIGQSRTTALQNMWNIYDYLDVNSRYNATFAASLDLNTLGATRELASWLLLNSFSDAEPDSIVNVAGRTFIPHLLASMGRISNAADALKFVHYSASFKPFIPLFRMLNVTALHPELTSVVDFTGSAVFEIRRPRSPAVSTDFHIRMVFKNGTEDKDFIPYPMFDRQAGDFDVPLAEFRARLEVRRPSTFTKCERREADIFCQQKYGIRDTADWCDACATYSDRGCDVIRLAEQARQRPQCLAAGRDSLSPLAAGFIGVGATLAFIGFVLGLMTAFGMVNWFGRKRPTSMRRRSTSVSQMVVNIAKKKPVGGDTESGRGVVPDDREFEMMDDVSVKSGHHGLGKEITVKY